MDNSIASQPEPPLLVDLDGTLIAGDTLWESLLILIRRRPWAVLAAVGWLGHGRAGFKARVADAVAVEGADLPYRAEVLEFVRAEKARGRKIVLATAADRRVAEAVAAHLGLFDAVIATEAGVNARGEGKLAAIRAALGEGPFDYMGDAACDEPILRAARRRHLVRPDRGLRAAFAEELTADRSSLIGQVTVGQRLWAGFLALRPHQWSKNLLLAVPMVVGHRLGDGWRWGMLAAAFVTFCLASSSVYLINDLFDLAADRRHPRKRHRPLASGLISIPEGLMAAVLLAAAAVLAAAVALPAGFAALLGLYLLTTAAYSLALKRLAVIDVLVLAGLYTLRIVAGGVATDVFPSFWLLTFSAFFFLSLAFGKRCAELRLGDPSDGLVSRGYRREDAELVTTLGPTSGYLAILVFCLYVNSEAVRALYDQPELLWLLCPILLVWVTRFWLKANRGTLHDDPVVFALKDPLTYAAAALSAAVLVWAS